MKEYFIPCVMTVALKGKKPRVFRIIQVIVSPSLLVAKQIAGQDWVRHFNFQRPTRTLGIYDEDIESIEIQAGTVYDVKYEPFVVPIGGPCPEMYIVEIPV